MWNTRGLNGFGYKKGGCTHKTNGQGNRWFEIPYCANRTQALGKTLAGKIRFFSVLAWRVSGVRCRTDFRFDRYNCSLQRKNFFIQSICLSVRPSLLQATRGNRCKLQAAGGSFRMGECRCCFYLGVRRMLYVSQLCPVCLITNNLHYAIPYIRIIPGRPLQLTCRETELKDVLRHFFSPFSVHRGGCRSIGGNDRLRSCRKKSNRFSISNKIYMLLIQFVVS